MGGAPNACRATAGANPSGLQRQSWQTPRLRPLDQRNCPDSVGMTAEAIRTQGKAQIAATRRQSTTKFDNSNVPLSKIGHQKLSLAIPVPLLPLAGS